MPLRSRSRRILILSSTALTAFALAAPPAHAADVTVPCGSNALIKAVIAANASVGPDTLSLAPDCVYELTEVMDTTWDAGLPAIEGTLTINGNHATIRRASNAPQFRIITNWGDLTLHEVTVAGGHAPDAVGTNSTGDGNQGESGGGIENWGPLTITDSVITGNTSGSGAPGADATTTTRAGRGGLGGFGGGISSYGSTPIPLTISNTYIAGNTTGAGGAGGNGTATKPGGSGGSGGFGAGVEVIRGTVLRITDSGIENNTTADGGRGGTGGANGGGGGDGGSGGTGAGVFISTRQGEPLDPTITATTIRGNQAGRGGDAGASGSGGFLGFAGFGGTGGGIGILYENLTVDGGTVTQNVAGEPGAGYLPLPARGGGIYAQDAHVTLTKSAEVTDNRPDNCDAVKDVPGCVNPSRDVRRSAARDQRAADIAAAAMSRG
jgi:hypothetical protein